MYPTSLDNFFEYIDYVVLSYFDITLLGQIARFVNFALDLLPIHPETNIFCPDNCSSECIILIYLTLTLCY